MRWRVAALLVLLALVATSAARADVVEVTGWQVNVRERPRRSAPVIAAGSTGTVPSTARLLKVIASLPNGAVVLPGLDRSLDEEDWASLAEHPEHPQAGCPHPAIWSLALQAGYRYEAFRDRQLEGR